MKGIYNKKLWGGRFSKPTDKSVEDFTESISFDFRLYRHDILGSIAHVQMLQKCAYLSGSEANKLIKALKETEKEISHSLEKGTFKPSKNFEDIHTYIEKKIMDKTGESIGAKLHTARSRNDQVAVDLRMYIKDDICEVLSLLSKTCREILLLAEKYKDAIMPAYTHMQVAKPIYFKDYIRAYAEMFYRDIQRVINCLKILNQSPLGAGAVGGLLYGKIDRNFVAKKLGFDKPADNMVDAVSDRDFVIEYIFDLSMIIMHLSRLSEDFILWLSPHFGFIRISDSFMTGSSILPQKKNPDVCELTRGKTGRVYGNLVSLLTTMKGIPLSYNRDMQEDKERLFDSSDTVKSALNTYVKMLKTVTLQQQSMLKVLKNTYSNAPIMVDYLAYKGFSLRKAHEFIGNLIKFCEKTHLDFNNLDRKNLKYFLQTQEIGIEFEKYLKSKVKNSHKLGKTELLEKWFNDKFLRVSSIERFFSTKSSKDKFERELKNTNAKISSSIHEAEKILKKKIETSYH